MYRGWSENLLLSLSLFTLCTVSSHFLCPAPHAAIYMCVKHCPPALCVKHTLRTSGADWLDMESLGQGWIEPVIRFLWLSGSFMGEENMLLKQHVGMGIQGRWAGKCRTWESWVTSFLMAWVSSWLSSFKVILNPCPVCQFISSSEAESAPKAMFLAQHCQPKVLKAWVWPQQSRDCKQSPDF